MIVCWPGTIKSGQVTNHISAFWDVMPTITDLSGAPKPVKTDGISFLPTLLGKKQKTHEALYWGFNEQGRKQAVRKGDWKLLKLNLFDPNKTKYELYNLSSDLSEQNDVSAEYPRVLAELKAIMQKEHTDDKNFLLTKSR